MKRGHYPCESFNPSKRNATIPYILQLPIEIILYIFDMIETPSDCVYFSMASKAWASIISERKLIQKRTAQILRCPLDIKSIAARWYEGCPKTPGRDEKTLHAFITSMEKMATDFGGFLVGRCVTAAFRQRISGNPWSRYRIDEFYHLEGCLRVRSTTSQMCKALVRYPGASVCSVVLPYENAEKALDSAGLHLTHSLESSETTQPKHTVLSFTNASSRRIIVVHVIRNIDYETRGVEALFKHFIDASCSPSNTIGYRDNHFLYNEEDLFEGVYTSRTQEYEAPHSLAEQFEHQQRGGIVDIWAPESALVLCIHTMMMDQRDGLNVDRTLQMVIDTIENHRSIFPVRIKSFPYVRMPIKGDVEIFMQIYTNPTDDRTIPISLDLWKQLAPSMYNK